MRKNWPYYLVASFLNTLLVTGAFIEFKLRGVNVADSPLGAGLPAWNEIDPFLFAGSTFVLSFLLVVAIIGISSLIAGMNNKLHLFNESLTSNQPVPNPFDVA